MAKDHGPGVIANSPGASSRGGKSSASGSSTSPSRKSSGAWSGGNHAQKVAAGRERGKKSASS